jgi:hypothetical protein
MFSGLPPKTDLRHHRSDAKLAGKFSDAGLHTLFFFCCMRRQCINGDHHGSIVMTDADRISALEKRVRELEHAVNEARTLLRHSLARYDNLTTRLHVMQQNGHDCDD